MTASSCFNVDPLDESEFRILVNDNFVEYLTIDAGLYNADDMCFYPSVILLFHLVTGILLAVYLGMLQIIISHFWHPLQINHLELCMGRKLRLNVYEATTPNPHWHFDLPIVVKFFLSKHPTSTQKLLQTSGFKTPQFLAHLNEEGWIIGFVVERIIHFRHRDARRFGSVSALK